MKGYWEHDYSDGPDLIEIGSCGSHVMHGAYGTAQKATYWFLDRCWKQFIQFLNFHQHEGKTTWKLMNYERVMNQKV